MVSFASKLILPLLIAAIATGCGLILRSALGLSDLETWLAGATTFCVLMIAAVYGWVLLYTRSTRQRLDAFITFEEELLSRLHQIEHDGKALTADKKLVRRVGRLEDQTQKLAELTEALEKQPGLQIPAPTDYEDEKIVPLKPAARPRSNIAKRNQDAHAEGKRLVVIDEALNEAQLTIRLQPILNLIDREIIAVEAFAFFRTVNGSVDGREFRKRMSDLQRSLYDLKVIHALSNVARTMEEDGQQLPIHYALASVRATPDANWMKILQAMESDRRLVSFLVPIITQADYTTLEAGQLEKLHALRETGLQLCLGDINNSEEAVEIAAVQSFAHFKINARTLLQYRKRERERVADQLLPGLAKLGYSPFVDGIEQAHQTSQLIDLDIIAGQGDYICAPKVIRLYKSARPENGDSEADGTGER